jgi:hypothetical protein
MKPVKLACCAAAAATARVALAGCDGSLQPDYSLGSFSQSGRTFLTAPAVSQGAVPRSQSSWISPDAASQDLLYVSDGRTVTVYSYPQGRLLGTLKHFNDATRMCADKNGNIYVVDDSYYKIFEYAHGGTKRLATLTSPIKEPVGCSINPTTGDLAVTSLGFGSSPPIAIYKNARGEPATYSNSTCYQFYFCGYDNKGNLFADGLTGAASGDVGLAELAKGKTTIANVAMNQYISWPGGVQWDGQYVAVGDQNTPVIYQFEIDKERATEVGMTHMGSGARSVKEFWIQDQTLIAPNTIPGRGGKGSKALLYNYPAGGRTIKKISKGVIAAQGAVVSLRPTR